MATELTSTALPTAQPANGRELAAATSSYVLWALRGTQASRPYFIAMCPMRLIPKLFLYDEAELPLELRAQRTLNRARVPDIARYITDNPTEYVFSAITASVDGNVRFQPNDGEGAPGSVGQLIIPFSARFIVNDGQHRRAGIEEALKVMPELGDETIAVVLFLDAGLTRSRQMFADLNKHAVRPTKSLGILFDLRDPQSQLARKLADAVPIFQGLTEMEKTTISNRSVKLFTLSGIYQGTQALLSKPKHSTITESEEALAVDFWTAVASHMSDWERVRQQRLTAAAARKAYIHAHGLALHVLGLVGAALLAGAPRQWKEVLRKLEGIDWSRSNSTLWEGRALVGGHVGKAYSNVLLTSAAIKRILDLPISPEEQRAESHYASGRP